ncbi:MAG TPA: NAD(+) synthase, partial [Clostridiales bacterium]|nr:NAD(+) synthase [Clostridiales bacterium]
TNVFTDNKRWFQSSKDLSVQTFYIDGEEVPIGANLLFRDKNVEEFCFGVEIGEDLWSLIPPSSYHALAGATMIFHLSASNETVGKKNKRLDLLRQHSTKCVLGYISVSSGINESSTDMVFGGHGIIAEHGNILVESQRFTFDSQMILSEIDVDNIRNLRLKNSSFHESFVPSGYRTVVYEGRYPEKTELTKKVSAHPFIPDDQNELN